MLQSYRAEWDAQAEERRKLAVPVQAPFIGAMRAIFVAESDAEADRIARPAYKTWFDNLAWLWKERGTFPPIAIAADYDQSKAAGTMVVGGPETVLRTLESQAERCGYNYLVLLLAFGSLTHAEQMRSLALFRSEIMPKLKGLNSEIRPAVAPGAAAS
jgi:alkanesulfonate monooxygenase SsuD/methylene tetrahydromethanopterin reductase-like flavin-dependent oxidoreductase (luciferase family)